MVRIQLNGFKIFLIANFLCIFATVDAQRRASGLVFNTPQYKRSVKTTQNLDGVSGTKARAVPLRMSLRTYCPMAQDQKNEPSCAAWATVYGAMTIHHAIQRQVNNRPDVDKLAHSKAFIFNQFCDSSQCVIGIEDIFQLLQKQGTCLASTFRNDIAIKQKPDGVAKREAARFRLDTFTTVYDPDTIITVDKQIMRLKRILADSTPIIVGVALTQSFERNEKTIWRLQPDDFIDTTKIAAHALCLIGYDDIDSTFELMNSWGLAWGNSGFRKVHYTDLIKVLLCAYTLKPHFETTTQTVEIALRRPFKYNEIRVTQFEEVRVQYDTKSNEYHTLQRSWREGTGFQLAIMSPPVGCYVYAFGLNPAGETSIFYEGVITTNMIEKVIPEEGNQLAIESGGSEYMCLMFSNHPLSNFREKIKKLQKPTLQNINEQIQALFSDIILEKAVMTTDRMGFLYSKETDKATVVILKIN